MVVDETRLALMLARDELHALVTAYCRAVDRADYAALRDLYHPEATDAHGEFSAGGVEQFITQLQAAQPYVRVSQHNITTTSLRPTSRSTARLPAVKSTAWFSTPSPVPNTTSTS